MVRRYVRVLPFIAASATSNLRKPVDPICEVPGSGHEPPRFRQPLFERVIDPSHTSPFRPEPSNRSPSVIDIRRPPVRPYKPFVRNRNRSTRPSAISDAAVRPARRNETIRPVRPSTNNCSGFERLSVPPGS
uniref:Uncharacterized protein n=1 Tax=Sphaerodactylus townsendi TaxID=933632 RepID=A0ACB8G184_9SAUR